MKVCVSSKKPTSVGFGRLFGSGSLPAAPMPSPGSGLLALALLADAVGSAGAGAACADTPGWAGPWGITCAQYTTGDASFWGITTMPHLCQDRGHRAAQSFLGATWNYPEENCCACGKGIASLDTRLWDDCDPRWETIKRGCPGYRAWETASDYYRKQSSPARSLGPGNPCFNVSAATFCPSHAVA